GNDEHDQGEGKGQGKGNGQGVGNAACEDREAFCKNALAWGLKCDAYEDFRNACKRTCKVCT
ncbi:hypothetical protein, partial [Salmonella sp. s54925]|uniref:hypothetical protein n=1 Tax=Salmonella sp. s54925 TaxID=3159674 RepID=UPI003980D3FA